MLHKHLSLLFTEEKVTLNYGIYAKATSKMIVKLPPKKKNKIHRKSAKHFS